MRRALLIVDVQNDFCEGGSLPVAGGEAVARSITELVGFDRASGAYDYVVACKDWHVNPSGHFADDGSEPDYVNTWPVHCIAGTYGAAFSPYLEVALDEVFLKGRFTPSYTGFDGLAGNADGADSVGAGSVGAGGVGGFSVGESSGLVGGSGVGESSGSSGSGSAGESSDSQDEVDHGTSLGEWLKERDVTKLDIVGLATDYCVRATALDAAAAGYATTMLTSHCAGVAEDTSASALAELVEAGVTLSD